MRLLPILLLSFQLAVDVRGFQSVVRSKVIGKPISGNAVPKPKALQTSTTPASSGASSGGQASVTEEIFNLVKAIVGAGVLSLPAGIAAFGNAPSAVVPAVALIVVIGMLSGYGFGLIGRSCALTKTTSYRDAWSASISRETSWIPAWSVTLKTIAATLAYSMILGDTFQSLFLAAGLQLTKSQTLIGVTGLVLLPLCLLKNLSSLAPFSLLGSLGMVYTAVAMAIRYFTKAYSTTAGSALVNDLPMALRPSFGNIGAYGVWNPSSTILLGMLSTAYVSVCVCVNHSSCGTQTHSHCSFSYIYSCRWHTLMLQSFLRNSKTIPSHVT